MNKFQRNTVKVINSNPTSPNHFKGVFVMLITFEHFLLAFQKFANMILKKRNVQTIFITLYF